MSKLEKFGTRKKSGGRKPGSKNRIPANLKEQILEAAKLAGGEGGTVAYLQAQAVSNPGPFLALLGKILPTQLTGPNDGPIQHEQHAEDAREKLIAIMDKMRARERETSGISISGPRANGPG